MVCAIVLVCLGLCVQQVPPLLNKLRLNEALMNLPAQTWPQLEALALTGGRRHRAGRHGQTGHRS
jgi:hypothetical protein